MAISQEEYQKRITRLENKISELGTIQSNIQNTYKDLLPRLSWELASSISSKAKNFGGYLKNLASLGYGDNLVTPADLFPGIRTASAMVDPEKLNQLSDEMARQGSAIKEEERVISSDASSLLTMLRSLYDQTQSFLKMYNIIDKEYYSLLEDMDSIHDIAHLSKNS